MLHAVTTINPVSVETGFVVSLPVHLETTLLENARKRLLVFVGSLMEASSSAGDKHASFAAFFCVREGACGGRSVQQGTHSRIKHLQKCAEACIDVLR